jgi:hypothetical protein
MRARERWEFGGNLNNVRNKMADDEMYLENLKEFVVDEERIVSYHISCNTFV